MKIHEYQGKEILRAHGVPVPAGGPATTPEEAAQVAERLGGTLWVVKSQIHAGGRGKGHVYDPARYQPTAYDDAGNYTGDGLVLDHGVALARSIAEVQALAAKLLGNTLVTIQSGRAGKRVGTVLVEQGVSIARDPANTERAHEVYLGMTLDRARERVVFMACAEGGVEIETVAARDPSAILKEWFLPDVGLQAYQARNLAFGLGLAGDAFKSMVGLILKLSRVFGATDASMVEVNPAVITGDGKAMALDAKLGFDDSALFRHAALDALRDTAEETPADTRARAAGLSYVKLDGDIGCLVNGAGLAMATMDIVKRYGGDTHSPANFLDVGGGANAAQVKEAFGIILSDSRVKAILVNIFGGIMSCKTIAEGVTAAAADLGLSVPLVVRLEGNQKTEGQAVLKASGLDITPADGMADAAEKVVAAVS